jgi:tight adherence protein B
MELIVLAATVLLVLSLWGALVWLWALRRASRKDKVDQRLGLSGEDAEDQRVLRLWHDGREVTTSVPGQVRRTSLWGRLDQLRDDAGWEVPLASALLGTLGVAALTCLLTLLVTGRALAGVGIAVIVLLGVWTIVKQRANRRVSLFERQLIDALELSARSLRAGHPLAGAFRLAAEEIRAPVGRVFAEVCQQEQLGLTFGDALRAAADRSPSADMKLFATSVAIQLRSGGNLADMMDRLVAVMRDRIRLSRRARILTAQTQFSKRILILLPLAIFVVLSIIRPEYMEPLYTTTEGRILLLIAGVNLLFGSWLMNRMAVVRY